MASRAAEVVSSKTFQVVIGVLLVFNAIIVGMQTYDFGTRAAFALELVDRIVLVGFTVELFLRFAAARPRASYFKDPWNLFDIVVVGASYVPAGAFLSAIRVVRVLRILRAISTSPVLRRLITALGRALLPMGHLLLMLSIIVYTYAVLGTILFGQTAPDRFGTLHGTVLTLFTVLTLEGWPDVMAAVLPAAPWAWAYFVSFLFVATYMTMNFVIGIIVNTLNELGQEAETREVAHDDGRDETLRRIDQRLASIEDALRSSEPVARGKDFPKLPGSAEPTAA